MGKKVLTEEEKFIRNNKLSTVYQQAKKNDENIWDVLCGIKEHYKGYSENCEAIVQQTLLKVLTNKSLEKIHSARFRVKSESSLLVKIVKKKAFLSEEIQDNYEIEKYRNLDAKNYYKIITDISGIRILIRYREQWIQVHNWIWKTFYKGEEYYLKNFVEDYKNNEGKPFIAEKPKVYYRNQKDLVFYEQIGRDIFDFKLSDEGYNSIHYLVNVDGKYIEFQVRTILDEAWSECTHDVVYKCKNPSRKLELEYLSQCLSQQTIAAETITNLIYEKENKSSCIYGNKNTTQKNKINQNPQKNNVKKNNIERRAKLLEEQNINDFDGDIDSLI